MVQTCCVVKCHNRSHDRFGKKNVELRFFSFPTWKQRQGPRIRELTKRRRMAWVAAVRRPNITFNVITRHMLVCSRHFQTGKPAYEMNETHPDWAPSLHLGHTEVKVPDNERFQRRLRRMKSLAAVSSATATPPDVAALVAPQKLEQHGATHVTPSTDEATQPPDVEQAPLQDELCVTCRCMDGEMKSIRVEMNSLLEENVTLKKELSATMMDEAFFNGDDEKVKHYTGLPYWTLLQALHTVIIPCLTKAGRKLSPFQMLLLTLMRLRLHLPQQHLEYLFQINHTTMCEIFRETISVLHFHLAPLVHWPARHCLQHSMPQQFVETFGSRVAVILDCFEIGTEKLSNLKAQSQTYSHYKQEHTVKYLTGITPRGSVSFISKGCGGRVSDKHLTEQCGILNKLLPGDLVLADRGFNIGDEVGLMCAEVKTSGFTRGQAQMDPKSVEETREMSHLRVHVKRVMGSVCNKYHILQHTIPASFLVPLEGEEFSFIDKIVAVCCALSNMSPSIVIKQEYTSW
uniref:uncharacterized protein LOC124062734 n=1 Tax=Scatophagus argus TaxID=75038 RepID=UPI001ED83C16|nr:uncharacterized protein LOC124062734 [Scatophagus argus]